MRPVYLVALAVVLAGCQNLKPPKLMALDPQCSPSSMCFLKALEHEYEAYHLGASNARLWTDGTVLGATGGAVIGAATNAHSDLYKATGGIALTALGFSKYGNFEAQQMTTEVALKRLGCAHSYLESLLQKSGAYGTAAQLVFRTTPDQRVLGLAQTSGTTTMEVNGIATAIQATDLSALSELAVTYSGASQNIAKAERILQQINSKATESLFNLQSSVTEQIRTDSFDLDQAVAVIKSTSTAPSPSPKDAQAAKSASTPDLLIDDAAAVAVINDYNDLARCLGTNFEPVKFD